MTPPFAMCDEHFNAGIIKVGYTDRHCIVCTLQSALTEAQGRVAKFEQAVAIVDWVQANIGAMEDDGDDHMNLECRGDDDCDHCLIKQLLEDYNTSPREPEVGT